MELVLIKNALTAEELKVHFPSPAYPHEYTKNSKRWTDIRKMAPSINTNTFCYLRSIYIFFLKSRKPISLINSFNTDNTDKSLECLNTDNPGKSSNVSI